MNSKPICFDLQSQTQGVNDTKNIFKLGLKSRNFMQQKKRIEQMLEKRQEMLKRKLGSRYSTFLPRITQFNQEDELEKVEDEEFLYSGPSSSGDSYFIDDLDTKNPFCKSMCSETPRPETPLPFNEEKFVTFSNGLERETLNDHDIVLNSYEGNRFHEADIFDGDKKRNLKKMKELGCYDLLKAGEDLNSCVSEDQDNSCSSEILDTCPCNIITCPKDLDRIPSSFTSWFCCELSNENRCLLVYETLGNNIIYSQVDKRIADGLCQYNTFEDREKKFFFKREERSSPDIIDTSKDVLEVHYNIKNDDSPEVEFSTTTDMEMLISDEDLDEKKAISTSRIKLGPFNLIHPEYDDNNISNDKISDTKTFINTDFVENEQFLLPKTKIIDESNTVSTLFKKVSNSSKQYNNELIEGSITPNYLAYDKSGNINHGFSDKFDENNENNGAIFSKKMARSKSDINICSQYNRILQNEIDYSKMPGRTQNMVRKIHFGSVDEQNYGRTKYENMKSISNLNIDSAIKDSTNIGKCVIKEDFGSAGTIGRNLVFTSRKNPYYENYSTQNTCAVARLIYPDGTTSSLFAAAQLPGIKRAVFDGVFEGRTNEFTAADLLELEYIDKNISSGCFVNRNSGNYIQKNCQLTSENYLNNNQINNVDGSYYASPGSLESSLTDVIWSKEFNPRNFHITNFNNETYDFDNNEGNDGETLEVASPGYHSVDSCDKKCLDCIHTNFGNNNNININNNNNSLGNQAYSKGLTRLGCLVENVKFKSNNGTNICNRNTGSVCNSCITENLCDRPYYYRLEKLTNIIESGFANRQLLTNCTSECDTISLDKTHNPSLILNEELSNPSLSLRSKSSAFKCIRTEPELDAFSDVPENMTNYLNSPYNVNANMTVGIIRTECDSETVIRNDISSYESHVTSRSFNSISNNLYSDNNICSQSTFNGVGRNLSPILSKNSTSKNLGIQELEDEQKELLNNYDKSNVFVLDNETISYDTDYSQLNAFRKANSVDFNNFYQSLKIKLPITYCVDSVNFKILMNRIARYDNSGTTAGDESMGSKGDLPIVYFYDPRAVYRPGFSNHVLRWKFKE